MVFVVDGKGSNATAHFLAAIEHAVTISESGENVRVAFDCEGVNLCRIGTVELVAICFEEPISAEDSLPQESCSEK